jgi:hypothetical protein
VTREHRKEDVVIRVLHGQVIESVQDRVRSLFVGYTSGRHVVVRGARRRLVVGLVYDKDGKEGGRGCAFRDRRPLNGRAAVGEEVRGARMIIRTRTASPPGCMGETFRPVIALESSTLRGRKTVGATRAKGYGHEG